MAKKLPSRKASISLYLLVFFINTNAVIEVTTPYHARTFPGEPPVDCPELCSVDLRICGTTKSKCREKSAAMKNLHITETSFSLSCNPAQHVFASLFVPLVHIHQSRAANRPLECHTAGAVTLTIGVTGSYLSHPRMDFIDLSVETGITFPSPHNIGSNSAGVPLKGTICIGLFDWLSAGLETDVILFLNPTPGFQENVCWYLKADHFMRGFSAHLGYSYSRQYNSPLIWYQKICWWDMHTLHFALSFDAARERYPSLPWVEFFYDRTLNGHHIGGYSLIGFRCGTNF